MSELLGTQNDANKSLRGIYSVIRGRVSLVCNERCVKLLFVTEVVDITKTSENNFVGFLHIDH